MSFHLIGTNRFHVRGKEWTIYYFGLELSSEPQVWKFPSSFGRLHQKIVPEDVPYVCACSTIILSSFNQLNHWFVRLSSLLRLSFLKLLMKSNRAPALFCQTPMNARIPPFQFAKPMLLVITRLALLFVRVCLDFMEMEGLVKVGAHAFLRITLWNSNQVTANETKVKLKLREPSKRLLDRKL